jgi:hypothetical protein
MFANRAIKRFAHGWWWMFFLVFFSSLIRHGPLPFTTIPALTSSYYLAGNAFLIFFKLKNAFFLLASTAYFCLVEARVTKLSMGCLVAVTFGAFH